MSIDAILRPSFARRLAYRVINRLPAAAGRQLNAVIPRRMPGLPFSTLAADDLPSLGRVLVLAPHPDDEALGCGGLIALLSRWQCPVTVAFATDGGASHGALPPADRAGLVARREIEARRAVATLAGNAAACEFLSMRDGCVPGPQTPDFAAHVGQAESLLQKCATDTLVLPWRRDSSDDHRAVWHVFRQAVALRGDHIRILEYPVWAWMHDDDAPDPGEMRTRRLDITAVLDLKVRAIACHATQVTASATRKAGLRRSFLTNFERPYELFFEEPRRPADLTPRAVP